MSAPPTPTSLLLLPPVPSSSTSSPPQPHAQIPIAGGSQSTAPGAQLPTLTHTHIRSVADAQKLFYAVQRGLLPKVERRLDAVERKRLQPGDVYVWEERGAGPGFFAQGSAAAAAATLGLGALQKNEQGSTPQGYEVGIERWTEGLSWSASRIREYVCSFVFTLSFTILVLGVSLSLSFPTLASAVASSQAPPSYLLPSVTFISSHFHNRSSTLLHFVTFSPHAHTHSLCLFLITNSSCPFPSRLRVTPLVV